MITKVCHRCSGSGKYLKEVAEESMQLIEVTCDLCKGTGSLDELEASDIGSGNSKPMYLQIDRDMGAALVKYIMDNGYISHEFHPQIHIFYKNLSKFLED